MAFNVNQPRDARGRFVSTGVTRDHVVRVVKPKLDESGITDAHRIVVKSARVRKYKGHETVGSYASTRPRGRATALRTLVADHKAGRIAFEAPMSAQPEAGPQKVSQGPVKVARAADVSFGSDVSPEFADEVSKTWIGIPDGVKQQLKDAGITVRAPKRLADVMDTSQTPRGWAAGSTWDEVDGVYHGSTRSVIVAQTAKSRYTGVFSDSTSTAGVLFHETGHGLDASFGALPISETKAYGDAYDADVRDYLASGGSKSDSRYSYFLQDGTAGPSEMFAEHFAELHGESLTRSVPSLTERFPRSAAVLRVVVDRVSRK